MMYLLAFGVLGYSAYVLRASWKKQRRCPHCWRKGCKQHEVGRLRNNGW